ncbi:C-type lectin domain family 6 member A-like, partial [Clarias magur]
EMQAVYEDISMDLSKMPCSENDHFTTGTADDIYVNTENFHPKPKEWTDISAHGKLKDNKKTAKIFILILGLLLMLGVLTLCVLGTLYHHKMVSYELLSEQHDNVTKPLMIQKQKAQDADRLYKDLRSKNQDLISTCNEAKLLYETLKVKHQQVHERLSACSANQNCKPCGEGWQSLGLKCYYFSTEKQIWTQSRDYCVSKGGHLVIITSQTEQ